METLRSNAKQAKQSHAVVYLDICSAFYQAQKGTICGNPLGCSEPFLDEDAALSLLTAPSAMSDLQLPQPLTAWLQSILTGNWSQVKTSLWQEHLHQAMLSRKGTRPGDPVADISFTSLVTQVVHQVQRDHPDLFVIPGFTGPSAATAPIIWVDDLALFFQNSSPDKLLEQVQVAVTAFSQRFTERRLSLNFAKGKTEVMYRFEGTGAQKAHAHLLQNLHGRQPLPHIQQSIAVSSVYTHLGIQQTAAMNTNLIVNARPQHAQEAFKEAMHLLRNRRLSPDARCTLAGSLIFSRLFYGAELWTNLSEATWTSLQAFVHKIFREIFGMRNYVGATHHTDLQLKAHHPIDSASTLVRVARLRYFQKLMCDAPLVLQHMVQYQLDHKLPCWFTTVQQDCQRAQKHTRMLTQMPDPVQEFPAWIEFVQQAGPKWTHAV